MVTWLKPENALRRANELVEVGRKQDALDTLHEVIKNRKVRQWTKVHEQIMLKHLELCVELRKPHLAKDGLFQYRNMCQSVNAKSLEDVIQVFLTLSEKKAEQARQESQGLVEDVEDLDQAESSEKLLLSVVTGEGSQERADRTILSPWLRFLWEAYRQCLELLRNNIQVETLYHRIAKQAFHFCLEYQRKAEFRKLCDNLRTHLNQIQKAQHLNQTPKGHYALKLTNPETVAFHQETRLVQLDIAIKMELWQEAFKSVEDVHQLMELMHVSKKGVRPAALASYYEKVALIFWKADNPLYHAAALMKLLQLTKEHKRAASAEELSKLATRVLLAVLSVNASNTCSDLSRHLEMDETFLENQRRLASLIKLPSPPTRQSLLKDAIRFNVPSLASPTVQSIYRLFEMNFSPLTLANEVQKQIEILNETAKPEETKYIGCLKNVAAAKILRQISQIYSSATFVFLCKIIPYFDKAAIENLIVSMGKRHHFQIRLHHRTDSVEFGLQDQTSVDDPTSPSGDIGSGTGGHQNSQLNVPVVQTMPGEQIRQHLQQMYTALQDADASLDADVHSQKLAEALRNRINLYRFHARDQHIAIINRKKMIESYKETNERIKLNHEQQQKEQERLMNEQKQREIDQRLQQEKVERLEQQKRREQEELKQRMMQDKLDKMKDPKLRKLIEEMPGAELDHDKILEKQILHLEQEKRETMNKLKSQEKKWDYYVRAMHLEELPLRKEEYEKWAVEDVDHWENYETYRIDKAIEEHKLLVETVDRMKRMEDDARDIIARIKAGRQGDFQQKLRDWEKRLSQKRVERLAERKRERKEKRREQWLEERREAERRKKEDEERQRREQEASGRRGGTDAFGKDRFQRRTYNDQEGDREPSGADSDKWVRGQTPFQKERRRTEIPDNQPSDGEPRRPPQSENWRDRNAAVPSQTANEWRRPDEEPRSVAGRSAAPPPVESRAESAENWRRPTTTTPVAASAYQPPQVRSSEGAWRTTTQPPPAAAYQPPQVRSSESAWRQTPVPATADAPWRRTTQAPPEEGRRETDTWREKPRLESADWERGRASRPEPQWRPENRPAAEPENWRQSMPTSTTTGENGAAKTGQMPHNAWSARRTAAQTASKPSEADSVSSWRK